MNFCQPLQLLPEYREYVWGGRRLRPGKQTAEAWVIYANDRVASGPAAGRTLAELAEEYSEELLGKRVIRQTGIQFPLLVKLLDCADWLSVQVHPNDEQAARLEGPGHSGKMEAWHVVDAAPGARVIAGLKPGTSEQALIDAVRSRTVLDVVRYQAVHTGDTILMRTGTIHALGPGLLMYEVQQTSDITYRIFDWDRPQTAGRTLHIDKSLAVVDPRAAPEAVPLPALGDGDRRVLTRCRYFTVEALAAQARTLELDTGGETFHALTAVEGSLRIKTADADLTLNRFESAVIPAACGRYYVEPLGGYRLMKASVEETP